MKSAEPISHLKKVGTLLIVIVKSASAMHCPPLEPQPEESIASAISQLDLAVRNGSTETIDKLFKNIPIKKCNNV